MGWRQLISIYQDAADTRAQEDTDPPTACPNDGEPLESGPNGELHCPFDGWVWDGISGVTGEASAG